MPIARRVPLLMCRLLVAGLLLPCAGAHAASIHVSTLLDTDQSDDFCSLREAIIAANTDAFYHGCGAGSGADEVIMLIPGTVTLVADLPIVTGGVTLRGLGADASLVDAGEAFRLLDFPGPANGGNDALVIEALRLTGGLHYNGGAVSIGSGRSLRIVDSKFDNNRATHSGGAIEARQATAVEIERSSIQDNEAGDGTGGGISVFGGTLLVTESTVADNIAFESNGGGIEAYAVSALLVQRSTVSGNRAGLHGGGLQLVAGSGDTALVESTTIVANVADQNASDDGFGGGIDVAGPVTLNLRNSVVALNRALVTTTTRCPDLDIRLNAALASQGYNFIGNNACASPAMAPGLPNANLDFVGTDAAPLDPRLGPLADNGGPTLTHLPLPSSGLVDQGSCATELTDQRGMQNAQTGLRVVDDPAIANLAEGCDIGSVEGSGFPSDVIFRDGFDPSR